MLNKSTALHGLKVGVMVWR